MADRYARKHVSKLVPEDHRVLMPLLLAVTIVNSAVSLFQLSHVFTFSDQKWPMASQSTMRLITTPDSRV